MGDTSSITLRTSSTSTRKGSTSVRTGRSTTSTPTSSYLLARCSTSRTLPRRISLQQLLSHGSTPTTRANLPERSTSSALQERVEVSPLLRRAVTYPQGTAQIDHYHDDVPCGGCSAAVQRPRCAPIHRQGRHLPVHKAAYGAAQQQEQGNGLALLTYKGYIGFNSRCRQEEKS